MSVDRKRGWTIAAVICISAVAYSSYIYALYSPGLILWQPDFLAFTTSWHSRFFPGGYGGLVQLLGEGIVAGRYLTAFGLALVMCLLAAISLRLKSYAIPACVLVMTAALTSPSVFNNTLSPSVDMLYSAFGLSLLAACFIIAEYDRPQQRRYTLQLLLLIFLSLWLCALRYHAPVLLFAAALALLPAWPKTRAIFSSILLIALGVLFINANGPMGYGSAAKEQVWCGLEFRYHRLAERGVLDGQPRAGDVNGYVWDEYGKLVNVAASSSYLDYYSPAELLKHGAANYYHYVRRPLVLLGIASALAALMLGIRRKQALCVLIFLFSYPLALSAAYYTLRASLLTELVGLAVAIFFVGELLASVGGKKRTHMLYACSLALLAAIAVSAPRLSSEIFGWRSQLNEAKAVEAVVQLLEGDQHNIWTEDSSITVRLRGRPIADMWRAYYSWLDYATREVHLTSKAALAHAGKGALHRVMPPEEMMVEGSGMFRLLLIRTPELARDMAKSGDWQMEIVQGRTQTLYILQRKSKPVTPTPSKP